MELKIDLDMVSKIELKSDAFISGAPMEAKIIICLTFQYPGTDLVHNLKKKIINYVIPGEFTFVPGPWLYCSYTLPDYKNQIIF